MKKRKFKWKFLLLGLITITLISIFSISVYQCFIWKMDKQKTDKQIAKIENIKEQTEIEDNNNTQIVVQEQIEKENPYWDYIKMNLIDVNFTELKKINSSTVGWIKVMGTNINYPFVQGNNNSYYLDHAFDNSKNSAGWLFMDYRNNIMDFDKNTIIYGHGRLDNTMFGSLKKTLTNDWLENSNNYIIKISTEYENSLWQIFSIYKIPTTSDYLQIDFSSDEEFKMFSKMLINRSEHDFQTKINKEDKIITLSTCYNKNEKIVLHAKQIKYEKK